MPERLGRTKIAEAAVEVRADDKELRDKLQRELPRDIRRFAEDAESNWRAAFDLTGAGEDAGLQLVEALRGQFRRRMADAREELARGMIDPDEFEARGREAAREMNRGILQGIQRLASRGELSDEAFVKLTDQLELTGVEGGRRFGKGVGRGARSPLEDLERWLRGGFLAGVVGGLVFAGQRIVRFFRNVARRIRKELAEAGETEQIRQAFGRLATAQGLDPTETLQALREAARGTASDIQLMEQANLAFQAGLRPTNEQLAEMLSISRRLGKSLNIDTAEGFERFIKATVRGRVKILDDIGLMVDFGAAHQRFAERVGKSTEELTEQEKVVARMEEALRAGRETVSLLGDEQFSLKDRVSQVNTVWANFITGLQLAIANGPTVVSILESMGESAEELSQNLEAATIRIGGFLDAYIGMIREVAAAEIAPFTGGIPSLEELKEFFTVPLGEGTSFGDRIERSQEGIRQAFQRQREFEDIRKIQEIAQLEAKRRDINREILSIQSSGVANNERMEELRGQLLETYRVEKRLRRDNLDTGEEETEITKERLQAFQELARTASGLMDLGVDISGVVDLEDLDKGFEALLQDSEAENRELIEMERQLRFVLDVIREVNEEGFQPSRALAERLSPEARAQAKKRTNQQAARKALQEIQVEGRPTIAVMLEITELASDLGLTMEELRAIAPAFFERFVDGAKEGKGESEELNDKLKEMLDRILRVARGALQFAQALGVIDDEGTRAVASLAEVADGVEGVFEALDADDLDISALIGSGLQVAGGVANLIVSSFGESREEKRIREQRADLVNQLEELNGNFGELAAQLRSVPGSTILGVRGAVEGIDLGRAAEGTLGPFEGEGFRSIVESEFRGFKSAMEESGLGLSDLERLADSLGLELDDMIDAWKGNEVSVEALRDELVALKQAMKEVQIERLFETFRGQLEMLRLEMELFDIEDPVDQLRRMRELFLEFVDLPEELEQQLAGVDLSTAEGRERFQQLLQEIFRGLQTGEIGAGDLGELTLDEFIRQLQELNTTAERAAESEGDTRSFQIFRGVTEITANRLEGGIISLGITTEQLLAVEKKSLAELSAIRRAIGGSAPAAGAAAASVPAAGGGSVVRHGDFSVSVGPVHVEGGVDNPDRVGRKIGDAAIRRLDRKLAERRRDRDRLMGRT